MFTAVIGHGRSPEGKGWGKTIDQYERVIRMWDWNWQATADYGKKYDYGLFAVYPRGMQIFYKHNVSNPTKGWLAYLLKPPGCTLPDNYVKVDPARWTERAKAMGGTGKSVGKLNLTRGTAAACWAIETSPSGSFVTLVGFDNVYECRNLPWDEAFSPQYTDVYLKEFGQNKDRSYPEGETKTLTHDMVIERPLLMALAEYHGVALNFAQNLWP